MKSLLFLPRLVALLALSVILSACEDDLKDFSPEFRDSKHAPLGSGLLVDVINAQSDSLCICKSFLSFTDSYSLSTNSSVVLLSEEAVVVGGATSMYHNLIMLGMKNTAVNDSILYRAEKGCNTIIACEFEQLVTPVCSDLVLGDFFHVDDFVSQLNSDEIPMSSVVLEGSKKKYNVPSILCSRYFNQRGVDYLLQKFQSDGYKAKVLAYVDDNPIALSFQRGNGGVITLISAPLLFSNFGISYNKWAAVPLINEIFRQSGFYSKKKGNSNRLDKVYYCKQNCNYSALYKGDYRAIPNEEADDGLGFVFLFRDIILYILITLLGVFSVFLIRRRHQAIPLFKGYINRTADYVRQVGALYYDDGDLGLVLKNKVVYFFSEVTERLHIQLSDKERLGEHAAFLAASIGCPDLNLEPLLKVLNKALDSKLEVDDATLAEMSDKMNAIIKLLRGEKLHDEHFAIFQVKNIKD